MIIFGGSYGRCQRERVCQEFSTACKSCTKGIRKDSHRPLTIDKVVRAVGKTIYDHREELAKDACEETKYGTVEMKINKILASTPGQWNVMRGKKSVGYIANLRDEPGVKVMAKPWGLLAA